MFPVPGDNCTTPWNNLKRSAKNIKDYKIPCRSLQKEKEKKIKRLKMVWNKQQQNRPQCSVSTMQWWTKKIREAFIFKHNSECEHQVILLMVTDGKKWYYLEVQSKSRLLNRITSNHNNDRYCVDFPHSFREQT